MKFDTSTGPVDFNPTRLIVAGWTGRDRAAVQHHIDELADIGVPAPSTVPLYYQCASALLTQEKGIQVLGGETSGEAEPFLAMIDGTIWLGLASDQTDRALETYSVAHSKQICEKPVASTLWRYDEVVDHLDQLELCSWIKEDGAWVPYQKGTLASILPLVTLMDGTAFENDTAMLCGTLPAIGGVRPGADFKMSLNDPVLKRTIGWSYGTTMLQAIA